MENKVIWFTTPKRAVQTQTKHVFIKDQQVFVKNENQESGLPDSYVEEWYPVNFQWIPVFKLSESLK